MSTPQSVSAQYLYHGMSDYWSGDGARWDDNKGCLFASYGRNTTTRELIDALADDYINGGDCDEKDAFVDVTREDVLKALLDSLTERGRTDYESNALCEFSAEIEPTDDWDDDVDAEMPQVIFLLTIEQEQESAS